MPPDRAPGPACSVSKACGTRRTFPGEMRGPLKEQIHNAINRALQQTLRDTQAAYINVGGRRRNRKKNKKNGEWSSLSCSFCVFFSGGEVVVNLVFRRVHISGTDKFVFFLSLFP